MENNTVWKGILIEESLIGLHIIPEIKIIATRVTTLEAEVEKGVFHFHNVAVLPDDVEKVIEFVSQDIKDGWYFHLVRGDEMVVVFHNKIFKARAEKQEEVEQIRKYALAQGIIAEQLPLEKLFEDPYL